MSTTVNIIPEPCIDEDIDCPLCGYNLRGLMQPRCPECGHGFDPAALNYARNQRHPFLFEHHPESNVRSFLSTARGLLRPTRFWNSLHPAMACRSGRLAIYWILSVAMFIAVVSVFVLLGEIATQLIWYSTWSSYPAFLSESWRDLFLIQKDEVWRYGSAGSWIGWCGAAVCWPIVMILALNLFQISMRRARIRTIHVVRCVAYGADPNTASCFALIMTPVLILALWRPATFAPWLNPVAGGIALGTIAWTTRGVAIAYRDYLRFHRPFATVIAAQIIVLLLMLAIVGPYWAARTFNAW